MTEDSGIAVHELRVDGGAAVNNLLMQIQADMVNTDVVRPKVTETTALGAAYLAGLATGFWKNMDEVKEQWQVDRKFQPSENREEFKKVIGNWEKAVERSKAWYESH
jgi:glycerol kinase